MGKPIDDPFFETISPLQFQWYALQIMEDKEHDLQLVRDAVEYAASFVFGKDIQKMRDKREAERRKQEYIENKRLAQYLGTRPQIEEIPGQPKEVSGVHLDFEGKEGMVIGQDPFKVLRELNQHKNEQLRNDLIDENIEFQQHSLEDFLDEIVVVRPEKTKPNNIVLKEKK